MPVLAGPDTEPVDRPIGKRAVGNRAVSSSTNTAGNGSLAVRLPVDGTVSIDGGRQYRITKNRALRWKKISTGRYTVMVSALGTSWNYKVTVEKGKETIVAHMPMNVSVDRAVVDTVVEETVLLRMASEAHAKEALADGQRSLREKDYSSAVKSFRAALDSFGSRSETAAERDSAKSGMATACYLWALNLRKSGDLESAENMARLAVGYGHSQASRLLLKIQREE
jgi:hypothetical protein